MQQQILTYFPLELLIFQANSGKLIGVVRRYYYFKHVNGKSRLKMFV